MRKSDDEWSQCLHDSQNIDEYLLRKLVLREFLKLFNISSEKVSEEQELIYVDEIFN